MICVFGQSERSFMCREDNPKLHTAKAKNKFSSQTAENLKVTENLRLPLSKNCALLWGQALRGSGMIRHWDESQQQDIICLP